MYSVRQILYVCKALCESICVNGAKNVKSLVKVMKAKHFAQLQTHMYK